MESFLSRFKNVLVLIAVLVAQLLVLAVQARRPTPDARDRQEVSLARSMVTTLVTPPERAVRATGEWFRGLWFGYLDLVNVRKENSTLQEKIERLELEQASLAEDARQGQRLQKLLDFRQQYIYKTLPAQVVGTSGTDQSRVLYIDKGSADGLEQDMPVVTGDGIVGRLKDVFDHSAQVLLISDPTSGVGVILEKTRTRGVLKGAFNGQPEVINVSPDERIQPGDLILTSGGDQIFPRGLPVGTVDRITPDPDRDPLVDVIIHPAANLSRLEEVLVVTNVGPSMSPQSARDLAASEAEGEAAQKRASDILSERLPSRVDQNAPADTNPDVNSAASALAMRPLPAPRNLHADQYTPGSVPPATDLTPGRALAPVHYGTEELPSSPKPAEGAVQSTPSEAVHAAGAVTAVQSQHPAGSTTVLHPAGASHPALGDAGAEIHRSATTSSGIRAVPAATPSAAAHSGSAVQTRPAPNAERPQAGSRVNVIVDGPIRNTGRNAGSRPSSSPASHSEIGKPAVGAPEIRRPATPPPATEHPSSTSTAPVHRRGPVLVPDDGSQPPSQRRKTQTTPPPGGN